MSSRDLAAALQQELGADLKDVSLAIRDRRSGAVASVGFSESVEAASTIKVLIAIAWLEQLWHDGEELDPEMEEILTSMITQSDNEAAQTLYEMLPDGVGPIMSRLGVQEKSDGGPWGLMHLTAMDELRVLDSLMSTDGVLDARTRTLVLGLMEHVHDDQAWGVCAGVGQDYVVALKNGWLPLDDGHPVAAPAAPGSESNEGEQPPQDEDQQDFGPETDWVVHSMGVVIGPARDYEIVVLTRHNSDERIGIDRIQRVSRAVFGALERKLVA